MSFFFDGNDLLRECEKGWSGSCYVIGVIDGSGFDLPTGTKGSQLREIVRKYLKDHPEELHLSAADLVAEALSEAWSDDTPFVPRHKASKQPVGFVAFNNPEGTDG